MSIASKEIQRAFTDALATEPPEVVEFVTDLYLGNNILSLESLVEDVYSSGAMFWEYVKYVTLSNMLRLRYRSNTPGLKMIAMDEDIYLADWADWQLQYGYYRLVNRPWPLRLLQ